MLEASRVPLELGCRLQSQSPDVPDVPIYFWPKLKLEVFSVLPFEWRQEDGRRRFTEEQDVPLLRVLTDRGTEYCGKRDQHEFQLYLALEDIDHTKTKAKSPQTNGICERFHKTILEEFYQIAFRKKIYATLAELQTDLDEWIRYYNEDRPHSGR